MKKILYCLISSAMLLSFAACDPQDNDSHSLLGELVAQNDISFSVTTTDNQNEYVFTNTSNSLPKDVQLFWDFGDGKVVATTTGDAVTKVYKKAGAYTVKMLAFTTAGQSEYSQVINVAEDIKDDSFKWTGFGYASGANLFKDASYTNEYYYAPGWAQEPNPTPTFDGNKIEVSYDKATSDQWQNQFHFITNIAVSSGKTYDFSVAIKSSTDVPGATVKVSKDGDDNTILFLADKAVSLKAGEMKVVSGTALAGFDGNVKTTFDFGGNPANTTIEIIDITLMEHNDSNVAPLDYNSSANLWKAIDADQKFDMTFWWSDANWSQVGNPDFEASGNIYKITAKTSTASQWQAQNNFELHSFPVLASDTYDFSLIIKATKDTRITMKLTAAGGGDNDSNFLFEQSGIDLKANVVTAVKFTDKKLSAGKDAANMKLVLDFGGCAEGTEFTIGDITLIKKN